MQEIIPLSTMKEGLDHMREWARTRAEKRLAETRLWMVHKRHS